MLRWLFSWWFGGGNEPAPAVDLEAAKDELVATIARSESLFPGLDSNLLLNLTKSRLAGLKMEGGLQKMACLVIVKDFRLFTQDEQLHLLSNSMKEVVLEELTKTYCFDQALACCDVSIYSEAQYAATLLLSPRTKSLNLSNLIRFGSEEIASYQLRLLLPVIASRAPCLERLICHNNSLIFCIRKFESSRFLRINKPMLQSILRLKHLRELSLTDYCINLEILLEMCKLLPKLETIRLFLCLRGRFPSRFDVDNFRSCLSNLKVLEFTARRVLYSANDIELAKLFVHHLPNLELIGDPLGWPMLFTNLGIDPLISQIPSKLRKLTIFSSPPPRQLVLLLPNVSELHMRLDFLAQQHPPPEQFLAFPKVTCLYLEGVRSVAICHRYMSRYGQNLTSLHVSSLPRFPFGLNLRYIFFCCPNLEELTLRGICVVQRPLLPRLSAPKLKKVSISWDFPDASPVDISPILIGAPNLQKVTFRCFRVEPMDLLMLSRYLYHQRILRELTEFSLILTWSNKEDVEDFPTISGFIKILAASAPKLVKIFLSVGNLRFLLPNDEEDYYDCDDEMTHFKFWDRFDPTLNQFFQLLGGFQWPRIE